HAYALSLTYTPSLTSNVGGKRPKKRPKKAEKGKKRPVSKAPFLLLLPSFIRPSSAVPWISTGWVLDIVWIGLGYRFRGLASGAPFCGLALGDSLLVLQGGFLRTRFGRLASEDSLLGLSLWILASRTRFWGSGACFWIFNSSM